MALYTRQDLTFIERCVELDEKWVEARLAKSTDPDYYEQVKAEYTAHRRYWRQVREAIAAGFGLKEGED
jgi:hypothetical protein